MLYPSAYLLFTRILFYVKAVNKVKHITQYVTKPQGILPNRLITAACGLGFYSDSVGYDKYMSND